jgi:membrane protein implicated in regulation of membrane protease activity
MTWTDLYLICFIVGFALSLLSVLVGVFQVDLPGKWDNFLHHAHGVHHMHSAGMHDLHGHAHLHGADGFHVSPFNFSTIMTFLAWFGGAGALLRAHSHLGAFSALAIASGVGWFGASIVFVFLIKVLLPHDRSMDPADYDMVGVLGTLTIGIRKRGTGELVYVQGETRKSAAACAENGEAIPAGEEVLVTRFEDGIAYVRRWSELEYTTGSVLSKKQIKESRPHS